MVMCWKHCTTLNILWKFFDNSTSNSSSIKSCCSSPWKIERQNCSKPTATDTMNIKRIMVIKFEFRLSNGWVFLLEIGKKWYSNCNWGQIVSSYFWVCHNFNWSLSASQGLPVSPSLDLRTVGSWQPSQWWGSYLPIKALTVSIQIR